MALTFTNQAQGVVGNLRYWSGTILFDNSYPTNGEAITAANFGFASVIYVLDLGINGGVLFEFDKTNSKIKAYFPTGGATASPTTLIAPVGALPAGVTPVTSTTATGAVATTPGIGKEVGNTTDLSTVTVQVFALGN